MFTIKYNSYSKEHLIYKNNKHCATITKYSLVLRPTSILTIDEVCEILDLSNIDS